MERDSDMDKTKCNSYINAMEDALYVIGGKWKLRIIIALKEGHKRFNDIQRTVTGISAKVLSSELKSMESNGLVTRNVLVDEFPVVTEYVLTDYSDSLNEILTALIKWGIGHREKITGKPTI
ncbi:MAG TPA: helix-turn-helix domain-containing protein [Flavobacteriaceae bacterium]|nr:helix-turn-helix transcriptional regulator [Flavobacteriaceae bacterium]HPF12599.1 helix-turn-helix domain-containing protein [Flavobacteriaceae bacterium]HQU22407.1 helix-turn-helix domain-containing protein [Flavobacteriaceae bacterium]HQU66342.1 helix-turn-helix domain-containing protein [Flavobacteriaceae bacterium]HRW43676.1 helix-turn-helix domain-containing protein [Flavobacteriaceae bacterium]